MSVREELKRRHRLASLPDSEVRINWGRAAVYAVALLSGVGALAVWCQMVGMFLDL